MSANDARELHALTIGLPVLMVWLPSWFLARQWGVFLVPGPMLQVRPENCCVELEARLSVMYEETYAVSHTVSSDIDAPKPPAGENRRLFKSSSKPSFVKPGQIAIEATL
jgi:hypothetical protein